MSPQRHQLHPSPSTPPSAVMCSVCGKPARVKYLPLCNYHYDTQRMEGTVCDVSGCTRPQKTRSSGLCGVHYDRARLGDGACSVSPCPDELVTLQFCNRHYKRLQASGELGPVERLRAPAGTGSLSRGYRIHTRSGRKVPEHREVMTTILGRELLPEETVHHKNGNRADNRPENLELWARRHPSGQRLTDLPTSRT